MIRSAPPVLLLLFAALLAGCTGRTAPLALEERRSEDAGARSDGGPRDSGGVDAGVVDTGVVVDGGANACRFGPYRQDLRVSLMDLTSYDGVAVVLSRSPFDLQLLNGEVVRINLGEAPLSVDFQPGAAVWLQFGVDTPQWANTAVALREIAPSDGPGRVRLAVWSFGEFSDDLELDLGEAVAFYEPDECEGTNAFSCGPVRTESLVVVSPETEVRLAAGERFDTDALSAANGQSHRYVDFPECTDTPTFWYEGFVAID